MNILQWHPLLLIVIIVLAVLVRYGVERIIASGFKRQQNGVQLFTKSILMIVFNVIVLVVFGLHKGEVFSFEKIQTGSILIAIGIGVGVLVASLSFLAIKGGFGSGYGKMAKTSMLEKVLYLITFIFLIGLAEDLFFIGFVQNVLAPQLGWGAIIVYLVIFVGYHYANVIGGVETKAEFLGTIPVRLLVAVLLAISFYLTKSLVYGVIIHNVVDTFSYIALLLAISQVKNEPTSTQV